MARLPIVCGLVTVVAIRAYGQTEFEVASVKPSPPTGPSFHVSVHRDNDRITMSNVSLRDLLRQAYEIREHQLVSPDWLASARFDIAAKLPQKTSKDQIPLMLQALLADRFKLTMHKESKTMSVYAMVAAKNGQKLRAAESETGVNSRGTVKGVEMKGEVSLASLADALSFYTDRPVLDKTGVPGIYEIELSWAAEGGADTTDKPAIFTEIREKMGLKLEARKSPVDIIVVDHAEKVPTEN